MSYLHQCLKCNKELPSYLCSMNNTLVRAQNVSTPRYRNPGPNRGMNQPFQVRNPFKQFREPFQQLSQIPRFRYATHLWELGNSPIKTEILAKLLVYYDNEDAAFLLKGFKEGFTLGYCGPRQSRSCKNLVFAKIFEDKLKEKN